MRSRLAGESWQGSVKDVACVQLPFIRRVVLASPGADSLQVNLLIGQNLDLHAKIESPKKTLKKLQESRAR